MKNSIILLFISVSLLMINACKKLEEGRNFSIHSIKNRLCNQWELKGNINDPIYNSDFTSQNAGWCGSNNSNYHLENISLRFQKNGKFYFVVLIEYPDWTWTSGSSFPAYTPQHCSASGSGSWKFTNDKDEIRLTFNEWEKNGVLKKESLFTNEDSEEYKILRLTKKRLKIKLLNHPDQPVFETDN